MAKSALSKTQIDRLGARLAEGSHTESDLRFLDDYRRSFDDAYEAVVRKIRQVGEFPTGRPAKSTRSIVEKLRRESIRLSQMQDIAGCRVVMTDVADQERVVALLSAAFPGASVVDRRHKPSHGYRAVHIIAVVSGKPVEIQVRTALQHLWAELSEKSSDVLDPTIKYGGGPDEWRGLLAKTSVVVAAHEQCETVLHNLVAGADAAAAAHEENKKAAAKVLKHHPASQIAQEIRDKLEDANRSRARFEQDVEESRRDLVRSWNKNASILQVLISWLDQRRRREENQ